MIEKLACDCKSAELMNYIFLVEGLFLPEPTPYDVPFGSNGKIHKHKLTEEEREELMNRPLLYSECMDIFKDRYNSNAFLKKLIVLFAALALPIEIGAANKVCILVLV